jgi:hypothetical protein
MGAYISEPLSHFTHQRLSRRLCNEELIIVEIQDGRLVKKENKTSRVVYLAPQVQVRRIAQFDTKAIQDARDGTNGPKAWSSAMSLAGCGLQLQ